MFLDQGFLSRDKIRCVTPQVLPSSVTVVGWSPVSRLTPWEGGRGNKHRLWSQAAWNLTLAYSIWPAVTLAKLLKLFMPQFSRL